MERWLAGVGWRSLMMSDLTHLRLVLDARNGLAACSSSNMRQHLRTDKELTTEYSVEKKPVREST